MPGSDTALIVAIFFGLDRQGHPPTLEHRLVNRAGRHAVARPDRPRRAGRRQAEAAVDDRDALDRAALAAE